MGFYHPATLVKDAQRRGVRFAPIDVQVSDWDCRVEPDGRVRLGLMYVNGLRRGGRARRLPRSPIAARPRPIRVAMPDRESRADRVAVRSAAATIRRCSKTTPTHEVLLQHLLARLGRLRSGCTADSLAPELGHADRRARVRARSTISSRAPASAATSW